MKNLIHSKGPFIKCFILTGFLAFGLFTATIVFARTSGTALSADAQKAYERGYAAAEQGEWELAIKYFSEAQKDAPESPEVLFNLGLAYDKIGGRELIAINWYQAYLASTPNASNAQQVRKQMINLEIIVEANIQEIIRKAKEASLAMEEYLLNTKEGLQDPFAQIQIELSAMNSAEDERKTIAREIRKYRDRYADEAYMAIAEAQLQAGDFSKAMKTADQITNVSDKFRLHELFVGMQIKTGNIKGAMETASQIVDETWQRNAYRAISEAQANAGDIISAKETAARAGRYAYDYIAKTQNEAGDFEGAKETVTMITYEEDKATTYKKIAMEQARTGDAAGASKSFAMAIESAAKIKGNNTYSYSYIAEARANTGDIEGARQTFALAKKSAGLISNEKDKGYAYKELATAQSKTGDIEGAKETARLITDENDKATVNRNIAEAATRRNSKAAEKYFDLADEQIKAGNIKGAKETASKITGLEWRQGAAYRNIAMAQANAGDIAGAKETASQMMDAYWKSDAYEIIANAQAKAGDIEGAKETVDRIKGESNKPSAYYKIAGAQANAGDITGAKETSGRILKDPYNYWAYRDIAIAQAKTGDMTGARQSFALAMQFAARISDEDDKADAYVEIAEAQSKAGDIAGARQSFALARRSVDRMSDLDDRVTAYVEIAKVKNITGDAEGASGSFTLAMDTAARMPDGEEKADAYKEIAEALTEAGNTSEAKSAAAAHAQAEVQAKARKMIEDEIEDWAELATETWGPFSEPVVKNMKGFFVTLKDKKPHEVVVSLANAAENMAKALEEVRETETEWQNKRAEDTK